MFIKYTDDSKLQIHQKTGLKFQRDKMFAEKMKETQLQCNENN